ncbi:histidine phosphatase family protein [Pseudomonas alloputida]|uniref:histidine phosphatase family protein n=1 Tax=Pseudomonas TaxID=286 RepID=UPI003EE8B184
MLIFLRHGQTNFNLESKWMGQLDPPLNSIGIQQAQAAAEELKKLNIRRIFSSPLARAQQTARVISQKLDNCPITIMDNLSERYLAEFEGMTKSDYLRTKISNSSTVEQPKELARRLELALDNIKTLENTLIVSHSGVFRCIIEILGYTSIPAIRNLGNGEYAELIKNIYHHEQI